MRLLGAGTVACQSFIFRISSLFISDSVLNSDSDASVNNTKGTIN